MQSFADLGVSKRVSGVLADRGITEPFAIQELVIADVLAGRDVLAKSPTGSGKTLAFMVPIVERLQGANRGPAALVLAPTRELAAQIVEQSQPIARARNLEVAAVYGGVGFEKQIKACKRADVLVATPGRLEDLMARRAVRLEGIEVLVLDEADRMLDMGFRPAVDRIVSACPRDRQTLFFSATLDGDAGRIAGEYTRDAARHEHLPEQVDAPAGSSSGSGARASRPSRCTATRASRSASARSPASRPARSTRSSRPTSPPAASTSAASRT